MRSETYGSGFPPPPSTPSSLPRLCPSSRPSWRGRSTSSVTPTNHRPRCAVGHQTSHSCEHAQSVTLHLLLISFRHVAKVAKIVRAIDKIYEINMVITSGRSFSVIFFDNIYMFIRTRSTVTTFVTVWMSHVHKLKFTRP